MFSPAPVVSSISLFWRRGQPALSASWFTAASCSALPSRPEAEAFPEAFFGLARVARALAVGRYCDIAPHPPAVWQQMVWS
eukprot:12623133-Alexandrium_andersonii.AAC.1